MSLMCRSKTTCFEMRTTVCALRRQLDSRVTPHYGFVVLLCSKEQDRYTAVISALAGFEGPKGMG